MNRSQRRKLQRLPVSIVPWEVALLRIPVNIQGVDTEGLMVVVEASGAARGAGPVVVGDTLWNVVGPALEEPPEPCTPARPSRIRCADAELAERVRELFEGFDTVVEVGEVPAAEEMVRAMAAHFAPSIGIDIELPAWGAALERLASVAPWRMLPDSVLFRFVDHPVLANAVALVMGQAGEQRGVSLFPSSEDYERFMEAAATRNFDGLAEVEVMNLYLDALEELEPEEQQICRAGGLVTSDGLAPRLVVLAGGQPLLADENAQGVMLAVVQGITALTENNGPVAILSAPAACQATTLLGPIGVLSVPPQDIPHEEPLIDDEHAIGIGETRLGGGAPQTLLTLKMRKPDALRAAEVLDALDHLLLVEVPGGHVVYAMHGDRELGMLTLLPDALDIEPLLAADQALVAISAGGPKRRRIDPTDFVRIFEVKVTRED